MKFPILFIITFCIGSLLTFPVKAGQKVFEFDARCQAAYQKIMAMQIADGQQLLAEEKQEHPDNLIPYFLDNYIDLLRLFFAENQEEYNQRIHFYMQRLNMMNEGNKSSPYYLFTKAVILFQWSIINIKFGARWDAAWEFRKAYLLLKENQQKFPSFTPDDIYLGAMQTVIGTIPNGYKWITNILGLKGSIGRGMETLTLYINDNGPYSNLFRNEANVFYCYLKFYIQRQPEKVFEFIDQQKLNIKSNQLYAFMAANLAINHQMGNYAMQVMQQRRTGPEYMYLPPLDFDMGLLYMDRLEPDSSIFYFKRFINNFKGSFYVKDAFQKISWDYYLKGDQAMADYYRKQILINGSAITDADKSAQMEAKDNVWPDHALLQSRVLSDGGYYERALQILNEKKVTDFSSLADKIEYAYRLGRIYDELGRQDDAIPFYRATIEGGKELPQYYAARAAWQMGMIYEKRGDKNMAISYYQQCLDMHEQEYKNSLDQWAKAGIDRISGK